MFKINTHDTVFYSLGVVGSTYKWTMQKYFWSSVFWTSYNNMKYYRFDFIKKKKKKKIKATTSQHAFAFHRTFKGFVESAQGTRLNLTRYKQSSYKDNHIGKKYNNLLKVL